MHENTPRNSVIEKEGSQELSTSTTTDSDKQTSDSKTETKTSDGATSKTETKTSDGATSKESREDPTESSNDTSMPDSADTKKTQLEVKEESPADSGDRGDGDHGDGDRGDGDHSDGDHGDGDRGDGDRGDGDRGDGDGGDGDGGDGDRGDGGNGDGGNGSDTVTVTNEKTTDEAGSDKPSSPQRTSGDHKEEEPKTDDITDGPDDITDGPDSEHPHPIVRENTPVEAAPSGQTVSDSKTVDQNPDSPKTNSVPSPKHKANSDAIHLEEIEIGVFGTNSQKINKKEDDFEIESETGHLYYVIDPEDIRELKVTSKKNNNGTKLHHTATDQSNQSILSPPPNGTIREQLS